MTLNGSLTVTCADLSEYNAVLAAITADPNYSISSQNSGTFTISFNVINAPR